MQILTIRKDSKHSKRFKAFECKFEPFEPNSKYLNATSNHSKGIQSIEMQTRTLWMRFEAFECIFKVLTIQMEIPSIYLNDIQRRFETFKCNFSKWIRSIRMQIWTLRTRFEAFNFIFKGILTIRVQISTIWTRFEMFECKF